MTGAEWTCPHCGNPVEDTGDGFWCPACREPFRYADIDSPAYDQEARRGRR